MPNMKLVRLGDRGPAVEDIQRRLLVLGYDLGPTGVDGVFFGLTAEAVRAFQQEHGLDEDGLVGSQTWAKLVDAGFTLGDRMLYLRLPHFHGRDVELLQRALNVLGFACGANDGIFGAFTEGAVREFQRNAGLPADGIVGPDTERTVMNLRHVWDGKDATLHLGVRLAPARAAEVLGRVEIAVVGDDEAGQRVAERVVNLAHATTECPGVHVAESGAPAGAGELLLRLCGSGDETVVAGRPHVRVESPEMLAARLVTAISAAREGRREVVIELHGSPAPDEREEQREAVLVLDAVCAAFD